MNKMKFISVFAFLISTAFTQKRFDPYRLSNSVYPPYHPYDLEIVIPYRFEHKEVSRGVSWDNPASKYYIRTSTNSRSHVMIGRSTITSTSTTESGISEGLVIANPLLTKLKATSITTMKTESTEELTMLNSTTSPLTERESSTGYETSEGLMTRKPITKPTTPSDVYSRFPIIEPNRKPSTDNIPSNNIYAGTSITKLTTTTTATITTTTTTSKPDSPGFKKCFKNCPVTTEYSPICGTDDKDYSNPGKLRCAQNCGKDVQIKFEGRCKGSFGLMHGSGA